MGNLYLLAYNAVLFCGWSYCLFSTYRTLLLEHGGKKEVWQAVQLPLKLSQTAALLEILHSALGVVRSPLAVTGLQVASRIFVLWGIIVPVEKPTTLGALALPGLEGTALQLSFISLITAWALSEIVRYGFFACKELGVSPYPVLWLRYSAFLPLYPVGVASELTMIWLALPTLRTTHMWSLPLPNRLNWSFHYHIACVLVMLTYLPGLPHMYTYMLKQRRKMLGSKVKTP